MDMQRRADGIGSIMILGEAPASISVWVSAASVLGLMLALTIWSVPDASAPLVVMRGFLPASASVAFLADLLTAYLVWGQARAGRESALVLLAVTYAGTAVLIAANAWWFPALFLISPTHIGEGAGWMWIFWHGFFAGGTVLYALHPRTVRPDTATFLRYARRASTVVAVLVAGAIGLTWWGVLPHLLNHDLQFRLPQIGMPVMLGLMLWAVVILAWRRRMRTVLDTWLLVAMVAVALEVVLSRMGHSRYTEAWYMARIISLVAALSVLVACLSEVNRLYRKLLISQERMSDANAGLRAENTQLTVMAEQDELTRLLNRRAIVSRVQSGFEHYRHGGSVFSLLMIDLDNFKELNDQLGHPGGDKILMQVAERFLTVVRASDVVGRYGGEEFLVFLAGTELAGAQAVGNKFLEAMRNHPFFVSGKAFSVTVSVGVASVHDADETLGDLISRADQALYAAKRLGRDCLVTAGRPDVGG